MLSVSSAASLGDWSDRLAERLRRVTSSGRYIPEVDGLRFVAVVSVFLFHLRAFVGIKSSTHWVVPYQDDWLARLTHSGNAGVPLFFMISGFILSLPFAAHRLTGAQSVRLRPYFARRLTRLEPPYLISLTVFFVMLRVVNGYPWRQLTPGYLSSFFYLHNLLGDHSNVINVVSWSLEVEVQFYALAPLLAPVFSIVDAATRRLVMILMALAAATMQSVLLDAPGVWQLTLAYHLQYFVTGLLLADIFLIEFGGRTGQNRGPWGGAGWDLVGVLAVLLAVWSFPRHRLAPFITPALFLLMAASAFQGRAVRWMMTRPWITAIGGMCYSIYLIHYQVISLVGRFTKDLPFSAHFWVNLLTQSVVVGLPTLAISAAFFLLVEKPCMQRDWPARLLARFGGRAWVGPPGLAGPAAGADDAVSKIK